MRDGADHLISVAFNHECSATCPDTAVEQLITVGLAMDWNMTQGYLFPNISRDAEGGALIRGKVPMSVAETTHDLESHARAAGEKADASMHSWLWEGNHKGLEKGGPLLHHGAALERAWQRKRRTIWKAMRVRQARRLTPRCILPFGGGAITRALRREDLSSITERP